MGVTGESLIGGSRVRARRERRETTLDARAARKIPAAWGMAGRLRSMMSGLRRDPRALHG
jgi:hypothetical protein